MKRKYGRTRRVTEVYARLVEILSLPDDVEFDGAELYRLLEEAKGYERTRKIAEDFLRKEPYPERTERSKRWWRIYNAVIRGQLADRKSRNPQRWKWAGFGLDFSGYASHVRHTRGKKFGFQKPGIR